MYDPKLSIVWFLPNPMVTSKIQLFPKVLSRMSNQLIALSRGYPDDTTKTGGNERLEHLSNNNIGAEQPQLDVGR